MSAVIVVPFRVDDPVRMKNWEFCEWWWRQLELPICEGDSDGSQPFDVTRARNAAVAGATEAHPNWTVALMTDADTILGSQEQALEAIRFAGLGWGYVVAHDQLCYLSEIGSKRLRLANDWRAAEVELVVRETWETVFVFSRELWETIGGFDEGFRGFGHQVEAFFHAASTFFGCTRVPGPAFHLKHPYSADQPNPHLEENRALFERYRTNSGTPGMRLLLEERKRALA